MPKKNKSKDKVTIIGAGLVGATTAYALMNAGAASEIALVDLNEKRLHGEVMDLNHGIFFVPPVRIKAGTYEDCADSSIVVITAGVSQKPGETRIDLLKRNVAVFQNIVPKIVENNKDCIILVVTNPVDILTYAALKLSGLPANQVLGSGTLLDSARFRFLLSEHCNIASQNVHAYIIGEHGDTEVAAWSVSNIAGIPFEDYCANCGQDCGRQNKNQIFDDVKNAAYKIIEGKGATYYAVGLAVRRIIEAILRDENVVLPVSSIMGGQYGVEDVCVSLPTLINASGIVKILELPLSIREADGFRRSAATLKELIKEVGL